MLIPHVKQRWMDRFLSVFANFMPFYTVCLEFCVTFIETTKGMPAHVHVPQDRGVGRALHDICRVVLGVP